MPSPSWRKKNPMRAAYNDLRTNSRRRGIPFTISLAYFKAFCKKTKYMTKKGRSKYAYTIDRIKPHLGYVPGNLRILQNHHNVKRHFVSNWCEYDKKMKFGYAVVITKKDIEEFSDVPF